MLKSAEEGQVNDVRQTYQTVICVLFPAENFIQTISNVMKPGAAKAVQSWMQDADEKGKSNQCSFKVFQTINLQHMQNEM